MPDAGVSFEAFSDAHLNAVKLLNSAIFPIRYDERVYQDALACGDVSQVALSGGRVVGALVARLEAQDAAAHLYIVSLGVLAPYRNRGIGSQLLRLSLGAVQGDDVVASAYLHVHTPNTEAIAFYARHGFLEAEVLHGYYKRLEPPDAVVMRRLLQHHAAAAEDLTAGQACEQPSCV